MEKTDEFLLGLADEIAKYSPCIRRKVGCVIVTDCGMQISAYNDAAYGVKTCVERIGCIREKYDIPPGKYSNDICYGIHAEQNAITDAAKRGIKLENATLYCTHKPCSVCAKIIVNAGIRRVVYKHGYPNSDADIYFTEAGVKIEKLKPKQHTDA